MQRANKHYNAVQARNHKKKAKPKKTPPSKPKPKPPAVKCQTYAMIKGGICVREPSSKDTRQLLHSAKNAAIDLIVGTVILGGVEFEVPIAAGGYILSRLGLIRVGPAIMKWAIGGTAREVAGGVSKSISSSSKRVGQWMSKKEYEEFTKNGIIPRTNVLVKGKEGYMKQANPGDYYVEFDIDSSLLANKNEELGWALVKSKNDLRIKFAKQKGEILPPPIGRNIKHIFTKSK